MDLLLWHLPNSHGSLLSCEQNSSELRWWFGTHSHLAVKKTGIGGIYLGVIQLKFGRSVTKNQEGGLQRQLRRGRSTMAHYKAAGSKREQFRRYLEKSGVLDTLTKVLVALYEEPEKPK